MTIDSTLAPIDFGLTSPLETARRATQSGPAAPVSGADSFAETLTRAGEQLVDNLNAAESASIRGINGDATTYEVASAVMEAEQSLRMAVAVREKVINAYLEISRMQI